MRMLWLDRTAEHSVDVFKDGKWKEIYSYKADIPTHTFIGLSDDFKKLIYNVNGNREGFQELLLSDGTVRPMAGLENSVYAGGIIQNNFGVIVGLEYPGFSPGYSMIDGELDKRIQGILSEHPDHSVHLSDWSADWEHIVVRVEGTLYAEIFFLYSEGKKGAQLVNARLDLDSSDINALATLEL